MNDVPYTFEMVKKQESVTNQEEKSGRDSRNGVGNLRKDWLREKLIWYENYPTKEEKKKWRKKCSDDERSKWACEHNINTIQTVISWIYIWEETIDITIFSLLSSSFQNLLWRGISCSSGRNLNSLWPAFSYENWPLILIWLTSLLSEKNIEI